MVVVTFTVVKGVSGKMYETEGGGKIIRLRAPEGDRERERKWDVWRRSGRYRHVRIHRKTERRVGRMKEARCFILILVRLLHT